MLLKWLFSTAAILVTLLWLTGRIQSPVASRNAVVPLDLGPYHIEVPAAFRPEIGQPGDPRRSRYVFMTIPVEQLGLQPPAHLAMHPVAAVVASLHLDVDDASRLELYRNIPWTSAADAYNGYVGHRLQSAGNLYVAGGKRQPRYVTCPWFASNPGGNYPMICNADESVLSAGKGQPDLTIEYAFRQDYWPELQTMSAGLKSLMKSMVTLKVNQHA